MLGTAFPVRSNSSHKSGSCPVSIRMTQASHVMQMSGMGAGQGSSGTADASAVSVAVAKATADAIAEAVAKASNSECPLFVSLFPCFLAATPSPSPSPSLQPMPVPAFSPSCLPQHLPLGCLFGICVPSYRALQCSRLQSLTPNSLQSLGLNLWLCLHVLCSILVRVVWAKVQTWTQ